MNCKITHSPENRRFITTIEGETALVEYSLYNDYLDIIHTYVPSPIEGRGVAAALVEAAYKYALENKLKPQATCSYAEVWLKRHPEFLK